MFVHANENYRIRAIMTVGMQKISVASICHGSTPGFADASSGFEKRSRTKYRICDALGVTLGLKGRDLRRLG